MNSKFLDICLKEVEKVVFFKRDELTTDLICCEIQIRTKEGLQTWFSHEETQEWEALLSQLEKLSGFDMNWRQKVVLPAFEECRTVVFQR